MATDHTEPLANLYVDAETHPKLYPRVPDDKVGLFHERGQRRELQPGEALFEEGLQKAPLTYVESGRFAFTSRASGDVVFSRAIPGMFIGDVSMFTGAPTIARCVAETEAVVYEVPFDSLRPLLQADNELGDLILRTLMARRAWLEENRVGVMHLLGTRWSTESFQLREFLGRNQVPYVYVDLEASGPEVSALVEATQATAEAAPILITGEVVLRKPSVERVAESLGLLPRVDGEAFDLVVIGGGPAGLAATVYGASEGLKTLLLDADSPGGQAGTSSKIENYLGFALGISGPELSRQAVLQARKFDAVISNPSRVERMECGAEEQIIHLDDGQSCQTACAIICTGVKYRRLPAENCKAYEGKGVYYAATHMEAMLCADEPVAVVGAGNSAGQAAMNLARTAERVHLLVRGKTLSASMSQYLEERVVQNPKIEVHYETEVAAVLGDGRVEGLRLKHGGKERNIDVTALFVFIGAQPNTGWVNGCVGLDERGFIVVGDEARSHPDFFRHWKADRAPLYLETTRPGIFAAGDVRANSVKRVAAAVGEGSMAVEFVHRVLGTHDT